MMPTNLCRMCGSSTEDSISLLDTSQHESQIQWIIQRFNIDLTDGLPTKMCHPCFEHINHWLLFQSTSKKANLLLTKQVQLQEQLATPKSHSLQVSTQNTEQTVPSCKNIEIKYSLDDLIKKYNIKDLKVCVTKLSDKFINENKSYKISDNNLYNNNIVSVKEEIVECNQSEIDVKPVKVEKSVIDMQSICSSLISNLSSKLSTLRNITGDESEGSSFASQTSDMSTNDIDCINMEEEQENSYLDNADNCTSQTDNATEGTPISSSDEVIIEKITTNEASNENYTESQKMKHFPLNSTKNTILKYLVVKDKKSYQCSSKFICNFCKQEYNTKSLLENHMTQLHLKFYNCLKCPGIQYRSFQGLNAHIKSKHQSKEYFQCKNCNKIFTSKQVLEAHILRVHVLKKTHFCNICEKRYKTESELKLHLKRHKTTYDFKCYICKKVFKTKGDLKTHSRIHTNERKYKCNQCSSTFNHTSNLSRHKKQVHTNLRPFPCTQCDKTFKSTSDLKDHELLHSKIRPNVCKICSRSYTTKRQLTAHSYRHRIAKFKCDICDKCFKTAYDVTVHKTSHDESRSFKCAECPEKSYKTKQGLVLHFDTHHKLGKYECMKCSWKFGSRKRLEYHLNCTHNGRK